MSGGPVLQSSASKLAMQDKGDTFAATFQYTETTTPAAAPSTQSISQNSSYEPLPYQRHRSQRSLGINGYNATPDPPPALYVRALYDYEPDDHTSLSFRQGDIIQVLTQLESGWWDGVLHSVRGWFPSNYCTIVPGPDDPRHHQTNQASRGGATGHSASDAGLDPDQDDDDDLDDDQVSADDDDDDDDADDDADDDDDDDDQDEMDAHGNLRLPPSQLSRDADGAADRAQADYWIMQATPDGRLFWFNTLTGESRTKLPLENPLSIHETGPRDRSNFTVPQPTRGPRDHRSPSDSGDYEHDESASEAGQADEPASATNGVLPQRWRTPSSAARSSLIKPPDSKSTSPVAETTNRMAARSRPEPGRTSVSTVPLGLARDSTTPKFFCDDGTSIPITWDALVEHMCRAVDAYRHAIRTQQKADFVRRAEDISDLLRLLLAAGSGTTDNHSGNPSIISTNKGLYPHFRDMMSRFSKLVLSSHLAAVDWPGPDAFSKCLQEADGVLHGVYGYVEVARRQRGEQIPRLTPGFVQAMEHDAGGQMPAWPGPSSAVTLDSQLLGRVDEARRSLNANIRRLEDQLYPPETMITAAEQTQLGDTVCLAAGRVIEGFKPFISLVESTNLGALDATMPNPQLLEWTFQKQQAYHHVAELLIRCQHITAPLADEWAASRGRPLQERLSHAAAVCHLFHTNVSQIVYSMQLLMDASSTHVTETAASAAGVPHSKTAPSDPNATAATHAPVVAPSTGRAQRTSMHDHVDDGDDEDDADPDDEAGPTEELRRRNPTDKPRRFFGQVPPLDVAAAQGSTEEGPWFLRLDHPNEVVYDTKTVPPQLKHGTLPGLVEQLTRHDRLDASFNRTFLLTYRSFTSAAELFDLLVRRFSVQPPAGINHPELSQWETYKQKPVRIRVVNVLKSWLEHYWMEDPDGASRALLDQMYSFARDSVNNTKTPGGHPLMTVIEQRIKGHDTSAKRLVVTLTNTAPAPILPKNMKKLKFLDIDATEFARQLTIIESKLYGKIRSPECLGKTWQKKVGADEADPAPNVKALILHSNQLTNWVAEMILGQAEVKKRVVVIKRFVAIADECRTMNNYSTLTSIVSALGTAPIHRLGRTWAQVAPKTSNTLNSMRQLMVSTRNFGAYRERLRQALPPCIPFLGVYLTDLTFIEDGIASIVKNSNLINFAKRAKTAEVIHDIEQYQNVPYTLTPVPDLQEYILSNMRAAGDVHEMYDRSLQIEPREREDEKIARLLSESGFL